MNAALQKLLAAEVVDADLKEAVGSDPGEDELTQAGFIQVIRHLRQIAWSVEQHRYEAGQRPC